MKRILTVLLITLIILAASHAYAADSDQSFAVQLGENISLQMTSTPFSEKQHKITKCKINDWSGVCLIDEKLIFGTDWDMPRNQLTRAEVKIGKIVVSLDVSCMYNPWFSKPKPEDFKVKKIEGGYTVTGHFSDGAGSYDAEWLIIQNRSVRIRLARGEC